MTPDLLRTVLARYPLLNRDVGAITDFGRLGFSGAGVWRVETATGPVAVRRWPAGWSADRLRGLHRLLEHVRSQGLACIAVPYRSASGDTLTEADGVWWQIEPWLPGQADYHQFPSRARLSVAMSVLARWHRAAQGFVATGSEQRWFANSGVGPAPAVIERLSRCEQLTPVALRNWHSRAEQHPQIELIPFAGRLAAGVLRSQSAITAELGGATTWDVPRPCCLRDIWHDHLLFSRDEVTGLIDPSACRTDTAAADLARLLGSLVEDQAAEWAFALDEYSRQRPLTLSEQRLIPILDRSGVLLSAVTWLQWLGPDARQWPDPAPIVDRLHRLIGRLDRLANPA